MSWLDLRSPPASNRQLLGRAVAGYLVALIVVGLVSHYIFGQSSWRFMVTIALGSGISAVVTYRGQRR